MSETEDRLQRILAARRLAVAEARRRTPGEELVARCRSLPATRGFAEALAAHAGPAVIAEIKRASPSAGLIRADFDPAAHAADYAANGASCLSVLTEPEFFQGEEAHLHAARAACELPVLRKDFIVHPWQVYETRAMGADCILLIAAALDDPELVEFSEMALELGLDVLVEVHDGEEFARALALDTRCLLGVNNRDLRSFQVDLAVAEELAARTPAGRSLVAESGIRSAEDIARLARAGIGAFLVGEHLMRAASPGVALAALLAGSSGED